MRTLKLKENIVYAVMWVLVLIGYFLHFSDDNASRIEPLPWWFALSNAVYTILPLFIIFLFNNFVLIPKLIKSHRIWIYIISIIGILVVYGILEYGTFMNHPPHDMVPPDSGMAFHPEPPHEMNGPRHDGIRLPMPFIHNMFYALLVVGINLAIAVLSRYIILNIEKKNPEAANVQGLLDHLKGQINPHFYMNMLNSIHGLIEIDPKKVQELVMELSRLMRYMLYDSSKDYIPLTKELAFLKEYIRIIKDRYPDGKVSVSTNFPKNEDIKNLIIPPLLFIVFIENAFKFGVDYRYDSQIAINIEVANNEIQFNCMNFKHPQEKEDKIQKGGLGLANIKKRLNLLFGGKEVFDITESDDQYIVYLYNRPRQHIECGAISF